MEEEEEEEEEEVEESAAMTMMLMTEGRASVQSLCLPAGPVHPPHHAPHGVPLAEGHHGLQPRQPLPGLQCLAAVPGLRRRRLLLLLVVGQRPQVPQQRRVGHHHDHPGTPASGKPAVVTGQGPLGGLLLAEEQGAQGVLLRGGVAVVGALAHGHRVGRGIALEEECGGEEGGHHGRLSHGGGSQLALFFLGGGAGLQAAGDEAGDALALLL